MSSSSVASAPSISVAISSEIDASQQSPSITRTRSDSGPSPGGKKGGTISGGGSDSPTNRNGTPILIHSPLGIIPTKSMLSIAMSEFDTLTVQWRSHPQPLWCELHYLKTVTKSPNFEVDRRLFLKFGSGSGTGTSGELDLDLEFESAETCSLMHTCLSKLVLEAANLEKERAEAANSSSSSSSSSSGGNSSSSSSGSSSNSSSGNSNGSVGLSTAQQLQAQTLRTSAFQVTCKQETLFQLLLSLNLKEGVGLIDKIAGKQSKALARVAFERWILKVKTENAPRMNVDKARWRLHAASNQELDLQAWYHTVFYQEVYRLRGPFWYRDAVLPAYRDSYDLVDNALSPLEEAALAHVMCSPDTSYGDVAGQMFVVQALVGRQETYALFQRLASHGVQVTKYPRSGRPAKKTFRVSFVEGSIYLTWKGKFGNQGVDLGEVTSVIGGIHTDVLKRAGQASKQDLYLSLICAGRSVDLCFESEDERNNWKDLLELLSMKEHGRLLGIDSVAPSPDAPYTEWLLYNSSIGSHVIPKDVRIRVLKEAMAAAEAAAKC